MIFQHNHAGGHLTHACWPQFDRRAIAEQAAALAQHNRVDLEAQYIDETSPEEQIGEARATRDEDVLARFAFQRGDTLSDIALNAMRVIPLKLLDLRGGDVLGDGIHLIGESARSGRPAVGEDAVGGRAEQQRIAGVELLGFEDRRLVILVRERPFLRRFEPAIQRQKFRYDQSSHSCLLVPVV